jgi:RNase P subunit RPR2
VICPKCKTPYPTNTLFSIPFTEKEIYLYCEDCHTVTPLRKILKARKEKEENK